MPVHYNVLPTLPEKSPKMLKRELTIILKDLGLALDKKEMKTLIKTHQTNRKNLIKDIIESELTLGSRITYSKILEKLKIKIKLTDREHKFAKDTWDSADRKRRDQTGVSGIWANYH